MRGIKYALIGLTDAVLAVALEPFWSKVLLCIACLLFMAKACFAKD